MEETGQRLAEEVGQRPTEMEEAGQPPVEEVEENNIVPFSKECWDECVLSACVASKTAEVLLLKLSPSPTEDCRIELEFASEIQKNEIKQVQNQLLQQLRGKTGNLYSLEMQVTKIIREKTVDKTNPDEKFVHLCKENPNLLEFKQRLNLSVS
jgi:hypothetical protein